MPRKGSPTLRVHGGEAAGRRLLAVRDIRPTQGIVKEAIFNLLGLTVVDAVALDLFSGSGALGIEALSRGAARVTFVEREHSSVSILRRNLEALDYGSKARVVRGEAVRWLKAHHADVSAANVIFLDPPYGDPALSEGLRAIDGAASGQCTVVVEHGKRENLPELVRLELMRERTYGDTIVTLLQARA